MADLFNLFEIHPAKCVCYPGMENQQQQQGKFTLDNDIIKEQNSYKKAFNLVDFKF